MDGTNEHMQRIAWAIKTIKKDDSLDKGINDTNLGHILKVDKNTLVRYKKGQQETVKSLVVGALILRYKFNPQWLFEGEGEPFPGARAKYPEVCGHVSDDEIQALPRRRSSDNQKEFAPIRHIKSCNSEHNTKDTDNTYVKLAFRRDWLHVFDDNPDNFIAITLTTDCMMPSLCPGDVLLVYRAAIHLQPHDGIYVLENNNHFTVRRIQTEIGTLKKLKLMCDNKNYETVVTDAGAVNIYGKVVWVGRKVADIVC